MCEIHTAMEFCQMKKTFYEKVGRKYIPVREYDSEWNNSYQYGTHLVVSENGKRLTRFDIDPEFAPLVAAATFAEDAVIDAIVKAQEAKPKRQPITERQAQLWRELAESFNAQDYVIYRPAARDAAEAATKVLIEEASKRLQHPEVKKAYEQFLMVYQLAK